MCFNFRYTVIPLVHKHADVSLFVSPYKWALSSSFTILPRAQLCAAWTKTPLFLKLRHCTINCNFSLLQILSNLEQLVLTWDQDIELHRCASKYRDNFKSYHKHKYEITLWVQVIHVHRGKCKRFLKRSKNVLLCVLCKDKYQIFQRQGNTD